MVYGRLIDGEFEKAPRVIKNDFNLTDEKLRRHGYLPVVREEVDPPDGQEVVGYGYELGDGVIVERPVFAPLPPPPPRVFSKLKAVQTLMQMDLWTGVKQWIEKEGLYDLYLACVEFSEDDPFFQRGLEALKTQFALSDAEVRDFLNTIVKDAP